MFGEIGISGALNILKSSYRLFVKKYVSDIAFHYISHVDKIVLVAGGILINVPLMNGLMRNHQLVHMSISEQTRETNRRNQDVDVSYILSNMLTESQMHKENNEHVHEEVDHVVDVETLCEDVISKDKTYSLVMLLIARYMDYLQKARTQSIGDMISLNDEEIDLIDLAMEQVFTNKPGNTMLPTEEDGNLCDTESFNHIVHIRVIILIPRRSCIMKLRFYQMDVKIIFLYRYLKV